MVLARKNLKMIVLMTFTPQFWTAGDIPLSLVYPPVAPMNSRVTRYTLFSKCLSSLAVLVAKLHADSNEHKLSDDFENPEGAYCNFLNIFFCFLAIFEIHCLQ